MKFLDYISKGQGTRFLALLALSTVAYFNILMAPQTVSPDAYFILPLFDRVSTLQEYFEYLFQLKTIDFQPVRDLSLFIDWKIFKLYGFNTFIVQNVLYWVISCFFVIKILEELFVKLGPRIPFVFGLCYSIYPLFSGTISWSIARKHILAFLFTILATYYLLQFLKAATTRKLVLMNLFYFLGIFSQPIGILWPIWAFTYVYYFQRGSWIKIKKGFSGTIIIFIIGFTTQYIYYSNSSTFATIFTSKTAEFWNFGPKLIAFGHYMYQIFAPYYLAFPYAINPVVSSTGYAFLVIIIVLYKWLGLPTSKLLLWLLFGFLPLGIILNTPRLLLDPYLLIPSFAFLVLICMMYEKRPLPWLKFAALPLIMLWTVLTALNTKVWIDDALFSQRNFERAPNCINAIRMARSYYNQQLKMPPEAREFLKANSCLQFETNYGQLEQLLFISQILYFEDTPSFKQKERILTQLGENFFYPKLILAALWLKQGNEAAGLKLIEEVVNRNGNMVLDTAADPIIPIVIHPFCEKLQFQGCLKITRQVRYRRIAPYL